MHVDLVFAVATSYFIRLVVAAGYDSNFYRDSANDATSPVNSDRLETGGWTQGRQSESEPPW